MSKFKLQLPSFVEDFLDAAAETIVVGDRLVRSAKAASDHVANARPSATISGDGIRINLGGDAGGQGADPSADASRRRGRVTRKAAAKDRPKRARDRKPAKQARTRVPAGEQTARPAPPAAADGGSKPSRAKRQRKAGNAG